MGHTRAFLSAGLLAMSSASSVPAQVQTLRATEVLRVGVTEGDARYQFSDVVAALILPGDTLLVADGGSQALRFYDPRGQFIRSVGGPGEGPGEYRRLAAVVSWRDSLFAFDHDLARLSVLSSAGQLRRTFRISFDETRPIQSVLGIIEPGRIIGEVGTAITAGTASGVRRDSFTVASYDLTGQRIRRIGRFNGNEQIVLVRAKSGALSVSKRLLPNGRMTFRRTSGSRIVVGETDQYAVTLYDGGGNAVSRIADPRPPIALSRSEQAAMRRDLTASSDPNEHRELERSLNSVVLPETRPAFSGLAVASDGRVLLREVSDGVDTTVEWTIFEDDGRKSGQIILPKSARIVDMRGQTIVTIETDRLGVEQVVRYLLAG